MSDDDIKTLHQRILLFALAGILLTGLVVGLSAALPQYGQAKARAEEAFRYNTRVQALAVGQLLSKWEGIARQFTSRSQIRDRLAAYNEGHISLEQLRTFTAPKLRDAIALSAAVAGVTRFDRHDRPVLTVGEMPPTGELPVPTADDDVAIAGPPAADRPFVLIGAAIRDRAGQRIGSDVLAFRLEPLYLALRPQAGVGAVTRNILLPSGSVPALSVGRSGRPALLTRDRLALPPGLADAPDVLLARHADAIAMTVPLGGYGWRLISELPADALYTPAVDVLALPLLSMLIMIGSGTLATGYLIRPLTRRAVGQAKELAATVAEQHLVLANARDFVFRRAPDGRYTYVSPAVERVTGFAPKAWLVAQAKAPLQGGQGEMAAEGTYVTYQQRRDGTPLVLEINERPYRDGDRSAGVVGIARDVTESVEAEQALRRADMEWNTALDSFEDAVVLADLDDRVLRANRAFFQFTHRAPCEVIGHTLADVLHPNGSGESCPVCRARRIQQNGRAVLEADHPQNTSGKPLEIRTRLIEDERGRPEAVLMTIRDLTSHRLTEQELLLAASVFEGSDEAIAIASPERRILRVNRTFVATTGRSAESLVGLRVDELCTTAAHEAVWTVAEHGLYQGEGTCRRPDGEVFPAWLRISSQYDGRGNLLHYIIAFSDISDKKAYEQRINNLAYYDVLTGLPNRTLFEERLQHALERVRRQRHQLAVLQLDLDRFKNVNDSLGHRFGDELLRAVGQRLRQCVRGDDTVARLGGDEFGVILEDVEGLHEVEVIARALLKALSTPVEVDGRELFTGASIGISVFPEDGDEAARLLQHADTAMFRAKERGRSSYEFYKPELTRATSDRLQLENELRRALERNELVVYYQPQVSISAGSIIGAEALVRWRHPERGMVPPGAFIPLAEETGLIDVIGRHVLEAACRQTVAWRERGLGDLRIAVNVAGHQILEGDIVADVQRALETTGLAPSQLELEITEGFVMARPGDGIAALHRLKALGVTLAIDDFGTGYSSLGYLKRLPIDRLKIDRSFIRDIPADRDDTAIASTIIAMAHHLDLDVIAEGVEKAEHVHFLRTRRCDEYQGFHISPPIPAEEFEQLVSRRTIAKLSS